MKVVWADAALTQLEAIYQYLAKTSPDYADRIVDRLTRRAEQIANFPLSGRVVPEYDAGQIGEVIEAPYRIIYYIKLDQIDVLAVVHSSRHSEE